jgi:hypothetical protein
LSQITYANPKARPPGLGPLTAPDSDREAATKNRTWAIVPLVICLVANSIGFPRPAISRVPTGG